MNNQIIAFTKPNFSQEYILRCMYYVSFLYTMTPIMTEIAKLLFILKLSK